MSAVRSTLKNSSVQFLFSFIFLHIHAYFLIHTYIRTHIHSLHARVSARLYPKVSFTSGKINASCFTFLPFSVYFIEYFSFFVAKYIIETRNNGLSLLIWHLRTLYNEIYGGHDYRYNSRWSFNISLYNTKDSNKIIYLITNNHN